MTVPTVSRRAIGCLSARAHDARDADRLQRLVPYGTEVRQLQDTIDALGQIADGALDLIVLAVQPASVAVSITQLQQLRAAAPTLPVVAWGELSAAAPAQVMELARLGIAGMLRRETENVRLLVANVLSTARLKAHVHALRGRVGPQIHSSIRPFFEYALEHAAEDLDVPEAAAVMGLSRRTLHHRLTRIGYPAPRVFLTWCRLLMASSLLNQPEATLDDVAGQLDFSTGHGLGTVLRRYTGLNVGQLREASAPEAVEQAFLARLARGARPKKQSDASASLPAASSADYV